MGEQTEPRIEIGADRSESEVRCWVRDNGIGIAPDSQTRVFRVIQQVNRQAKGSGIVLALARRIIEVHHGRIWVESKGLGTGSTFYLAIPSKPELSGAKAV